MICFKADTSGLDDLVNDLKHYSFEVECPECHHDVSVSMDDIGKTIVCKNCGVSITIKSE